jgi:uncharacterized OsmC-like protein
MTKVPQYAAVLKVPLDGVTMTGRWGMHTEGSALKETLQTNPIGLDVEIRLDSDASVEDLARVVRTAERACHSTQAMKQVVPTRIQVEVRGEPIDPNLVSPDT